MAHFDLHETHVRSWIGFHKAKASPDGKVISLEDITGFPTCLQKGLPQGIRLFEINVALWKNSCAGFTYNIVLIIGNTALCGC